MRITENVEGDLFRPGNLKMIKRWHCQGTAGKVHPGHCNSLRRHYPDQVQWVSSQAQPPPLQIKRDLREQSPYKEFTLPCQRVHFFTWAVIQPVYMIMLFCISSISDLSILRCCGVYICRSGASPRIRRRWTGHTLSRRGAAPTPAPIFYIKTINYTPNNRLQLGL